jgi:hypothetical protein
MQLGWLGVACPASFDRASQPPVFGFGHHTDAALLREDFGEGCLNIGRSMRSPGCKATTTGLRSPYRNEA